LFTTVIEIDARQYARIEIGGLFVIFETGKGITLLGLPGRKGSRCEPGDECPLKLRISCGSGILME